MKVSLALNWSKSGGSIVAGKYEGKFNMAVGVAKQKIGELTGNKQLQREGQFQKLKGATQDATEGAKTAVKNTVKATSKILENELNNGLGHIKNRFKP